MLKPDALAEIHKPRSGFLVENESCLPVEVDRSLIRREGADQHRIGHLAELPLEQSQRFEPDSSPTDIRIEDQRLDTQLGWVNLDPNEAGRLVVNLDCTHLANGKEQLPQGVPSQTAICNGDLLIAVELATQGLEEQGTF